MREQKEARKLEERRKKLLERIEEGKRLSEERKQDQEARAWVRLCGTAPAAPFLFAITFPSGWVDRTQPVDIVLVELAFRDLTRWCRGEHRPALLAAVIETDNVARLVSDRVLNIDLDLTGNVAGGEREVLVVEFDVGIDDFTRSQIVGDAGQTECVTLVSPPRVHEHDDVAVALDAGRVEADKVLAGDAAVHQSQPTAGHLIPGVEGPPNGGGGLVEADVTRTRLIDAVNDAIHVPIDRYRGFALTAPERVACIAGLPTRRGLNPGLGSNGEQGERG